VGPAGCVRHGGCGRLLRRSQPVRRGAGGVRHARGTVRVRLLRRRCRGRGRRDCLRSLWCRCSCTRYVFFARVVDFCKFRSNVARLSIQHPLLPPLPRRCPATRPLTTTTSGRTAPTTEKPQRDSSTAPGPRQRAHRPHPAWWWPVRRRLRQHLQRPERPEQTPGPPLRPRVLQRRAHRLTRPPQLELPPLRAAPGPAPQPAPLRKWTPLQRPPPGRNTRSRFVKCAIRNILRLFYGIFGIFDFHVVCSRPSPYLSRVIAHLTYAAPADSCHSTRSGTKSSAKRPGPTPIPQSSRRLRCNYCS
jgi:hypothetical protein